MRRKLHKNRNTNKQQQLNTMGVKVTNTLQKAPEGTRTTAISKHSSSSSAKSDKDLETLKVSSTKKKCGAACGKGATTAKQSRAEPPGSSGGGERRKAGRAQTHRVVASSRGGLAGRVRVHRVDDGLPLALLVDLPEATAGLPVRGLSLEVLLILIHIVHLGEQRGRRGGERWE